MRPCQARSTEAAPVSAQDGKKQPQSETVQADVWSRMGVLRARASSASLCAQLYRML